MNSNLPEIDYQAHPILFVDDEADACDAFRLQFRREFMIFTAQNGKEAMEILTRENPAVIITDQRMPTTRGVDLLRMAKEAKPEIIRILITAYSDMDVVVEAINIGHVSRYITKPYNEEALRRIFREAIREYHGAKEQDRLYAKRLEMLRRMARANRLSALGVMAAGMAHEIDDSLTAIITFLQTLEERQKEKEPEIHDFEDFYKTISTESGRIRHVVPRLRRYAKFSGQEPIRFEMGNLTEVIDDVILLLQSEATQKGLQMVKECASPIPTSRFDGERMKQLFLNLLLNAIQATTAGSIQIRLELVQAPDSDPRVQMAIRDTGCGIAEEHLKELFDPFLTHLDEGRSHLGLLLCLHVVEEHRGTIKVESKRGEGSTFTVRLPLDPTR